MVGVLDFVSKIFAVTKLGQNSVQHNAVGTVAVDMEPHSRIIAAISNYMTNHSVGVANMSFLAERNGMLVRKLTREAGWSFFRAEKTAATFDHKIPTINGPFRANTPYTF